MKKVLLIALCLFSLATTRVSAQIQIGYDKPSVQCLGVELDGSVTLRVEGYGRNRADAKEQAMKNAVWAVIFDGVRNGVKNAPIRPLVTEVNAQERYEDYFNIFFSDNGEYMTYISLKDTKKFSGSKTKDRIGYSYQLTIRVLRADLKKRLQDDNVID